MPCSIFCFIVTYCISYFIDAYCSTFSTAGSGAVAGPPSNVSKSFVKCDEDSIYLITIVYCSTSFKNVEVSVVFKDASPLVINITGSIQRTSFLNGNVTRNAVEIGINKQNVTRLKKDAIKHLLHLRKVTIKNTNLTKMDPGLFRNTPRLETIEFVANKLKVVSRGVFNQSSIHKISLANNEIHFISYKAFSNLTNLKYLNVSYNRLRMFNGTWFSALPNLTSLDFQYNQIEIIPKSAFRNTKNLTHIYLNDNNIVTIESGTFDVLKSLVHLSLKYNLLKTIKEDVFPAKFKIDTLLINANRLNFLKESVISSIFIRRIGLDGNPWHCYCYRNMQKILRRLGSVIISSRECEGLDVPKCAASSNGVMDCNEDYDEDMTRFFYKQVHEKNSKCTRFLEELKKNDGGFLN